MNHRRKGFTIIELIMATTVFSLVLLLGLTGFIQVGRMFYKGVSLAQTRQVTKDITDSVAKDLRLAATMSGKIIYGSNQYYYCIGNHRYKVNQYKELNAIDTSSSNYGLLRETMPGTSCDASTASINPTASPEMLGSRMRILKFDVNQITPDMYSVSIRVAYGDDDDLTNPNSPDASCKASLVSTQFCAVTEFNTRVFRGVVGA